MERLPRHFVRHERYTRYKNNFEIETINNLNDGKEMSQMPYENRELYKSTDCSKGNCQKGWSGNNRANSSYGQVRQNSKEVVGENQTLYIKSNLYSNQIDKKISPSSNKYYQNIKHVDNQISHRETMSDILVMAKDTSGSEDGSTSSKIVENLYNVEIIMDNTHEIISQSDGRFSTEVSREQRFEKVTIGANEEVEEMVPVNQENITVKRALKKPRKWCGTTRNRRVTNNIETSSHGEITQNYQSYSKLTYYQKDKGNNPRSNDSGENVFYKEQSKIDQTIKYIVPEVSSQEFQMQSQSNDVVKRPNNSSLFFSFSDSYLTAGPKTKSNFDTLQTTFDICTKDSLKNNLFHAVASLPNQSLSNINSLPVDQNETVTPMLALKLVTTKIFDKSKLQDSEDCYNDNNGQDYGSSSEETAETSIISPKPPRQRLPMKLRTDLRTGLVATTSVLQKKLPKKYRRRPSNLAASSESSSLTLSSSSSLAFMMDGIQNDGILSIILDKVKNRVIKQVVMYFLYACFLIQKNGRKLFYFIVLPLFYFGIFFLAYCSCRTVCTKSNDNIIQEIPV